MEERKNSWHLVISQPFCHLSITHDSWLWCKQLYFDASCTNMAPSVRTAPNTWLLLTYVVTKLHFFFWLDKDLNSGLWAYEAGDVPLEPRLQSFVLGLFGRWGGVLIFFCLGWLKSWPSYFKLPADTGMTDICYHAQLFSLEMGSG
jgi:hypothetical protein